MFLTVDQTNRIGERVVLRAMFEARKRVFVDLLKWNIPVLDGRYEIDQFDDHHARYIILAGSAGEHLASARLLPTIRPAILDTMFADLVDGVPPAGERIYEITRFCISPALRAGERRLARDRLVTALAIHAMTNGIESYTGVAERAWLRQILAFGWDCVMLGEPRLHGRTLLGALRIDIGPDTLLKLGRAGICRDADDMLPAVRAA